MINFRSILSLVSLDERIVPSSTTYEHPIDVTVPTAMPNSGTVSQISINASIISDSNTTDYNNDNLTDAERDAKILALLEKRDILDEEIEILNRDILQTSEEIERKKSAIESIRIQILTEEAVLKIFLDSKGSEEAIADARKRIENSKIRLEEEEAKLTTLEINLDADIREKDRKILKRAAISDQILKLLKPAQVQVPQISQVLTTPANNTAP